MNRKMRLRWRIAIKEAGLVAWVIFLWVASVSLLTYGNIRLYGVMNANAPFWVWLLVAAVLNVVFCWSIWDGLMSYTFDKFDMKERRD